MKFILIFILTTWSLVSFSQVNTRYSMRTCMLLPVQDNVQGAVGFKVFKGIEDYLKNSEWCYYRANSEILNILGNYKQNLHQHLENNEVIRVLAGKIRAGSVIKINLKPQVKGMEVNLKIVGDNGNDVYFLEKGVVDQNDVDLYIRTIINWLEVYERAIPYDGRVIGVLGNQFTIDIGKSSFVKVGQRIDVVRPITKKSHPLLEAVVEWETELLGNGQVSNVSEFQANGLMEDYRTRKKLGVGDWVRFKRDDPNKTQKITYPEVDKQEFGKLGEVQLGLKLGQGSDTISKNSQNRKIGGLLYGLWAKGTGFITRRYWTSLEIERSFASYSKKEGTVTPESNSITQGIVKVKAGYKYLPLGFFYGPQINLYGGYGVYSYGLDQNTSQGFGDHKFKGILLGFSGDAPLHKLFRVFMKFDVLFSPGYSEDTTVFGDDDSSSSYQIEAGARYNYSPKMAIDGSLELTSNKAEFDNGDEVHFKEIALKVGAKFGF